MFLDCATRARSFLPRSPAWRSGPSPTGRTRSKKRASPSASSAGRRSSVPDALLDKLRAAVGAANLLTGVELSPYVVEGRTPEAAVFPGSIEEVAVVMALASQVGRSVTPWGGGTAASVGMPAPRAGLIMGLRRLGRLLDHEPGDLTATVEAGMTVAALQTALGSRGQWLSLDPADADRATLG